MKTLKITAMNRYYVVDIGDNRIHMLNEKSLIYFLKHQVGFDKTAIHSIFTTLGYQAVVEIDLDKTERKVS